MRREGSFVQSHRPYAVNLASFGPIDEMNRHGDDIRWFGIDAIWFRRRRGVGTNAAAETSELRTVACVGQLRDLQRPAPADAAAFLVAHDDGRYGGDCLGRWDGERYWGSQLPDVIEAHLALLKPMLAAYPVIPDGFDGWWRF